MKTMTSAVLILLLILVSLTAVAETKIMVASDLHYLSPSLYKGSDLFLRSIAKGDGKMTQYSDILLQALILQAERVRPDVLLLTGDLTFNGERQSHQELADALAALVQEGISVYVLPGNHDINMTSAYAFSGDTYRKTDSVTAEEFMSIYQSCMGPVTQDQIGMSYTVIPAPDLEICMLDCAVYEPVSYAYGFLDENRFRWFEDQLSNAEKEGRLFISASHQNVVPHSSLWQNSYVIINAERLISSMQQHHAPLHLSGHLHIQHISEQNGLYDIASGAYSVYPHLYGLLSIDDRHAISYQAQPIDADLLPEDFTSMGETWFRSTMLSKTEASLQALGIPEQEMNTMLDYAEDLNLAYFSGTLTSDDSHSLWKESEGYDLWMQYKETLFFAQYIDLVLSEASENARSLSIP